MSKLNVNFAGVEFENPIWLGSATPTWDGKRMKEASNSFASGLVPKTIGPKQDWAKHPRNGRLALIKSKGKEIGMINLELFTTKTRKEWLKNDLKIAAEGDSKIIASILAMPEPEETKKLVDEIQSTGLVDLLELNVSCPMPASTVGMHIGKNPELVYQQTKAAKSVASIPLSVKMTPNISDMVDVAKAVESANGDGLTISNSVKGFAGVNINTGKPILKAYGGYSGPAIKPIVQRHISQVAKNVDLPISAVGGIKRWEDVIEYIMLGATTVQVVTAVMWNGYNKLNEFVNGIKKFMEEQGYKSLDEIRGIALEDITTTEELAELPPKFAKINKENCINCGICNKVCFYDAIKVKEKETEVKYNNCDGCGACVIWCPVEGAISLFNESEL